MFTHNVLTMAVLAASLLTSAQGFADNTTIEASADSGGSSKVQNDVNVEQRRHGASLSVDQDSSLSRSQQVEVGAQGAGPITVATATHTDIAMDAELSLTAEPQVEAVSSATEKGMALMTDTEQSATDLVKEKAAQASSAGKSRLDSSAAAAGRAQKTVGRAINADVASSVRNSVDQTVKTSVSDAVDAAVQQTVSNAVTNSISGSL